MDSWILSEAKQRHEDLRSFGLRDRLGRSEKAAGLLVASREESGGKTVVVILPDTGSVT